MPVIASGSASSDYFEPEDPEFNQALQDAVLPGDVRTTDSNVTVVAETPEPRATLKRPRSPSEEADIPTTSFHQVPAGKSREAGDEDDTYGRSHFGAFGEYMRRKRAKLQIQNSAQLEGEDESEKSRIFEGVAIYVCIIVRFSLLRFAYGRCLVQIDGWTQPSVQDLRQLIVKHGGTFQAYLDKKSIV